MTFPRREVEKLLAAVHRRCCICHRFCGVKIETDHIVPRADGGPDEIDNAIPVCFECHAEIHAYNDRHPRGRKFHPDELRRHKEQWLAICTNHPEIFATSPAASEVGPLQALIDELEFDEAVARRPDHAEQGCLLLDEQFRRALREGAISLLRDELKSKLIAAYVAIGRANQHIAAVAPHEEGANAWATASSRAAGSIRTALPQITQARTALIEFLGSESGAA